MNYPKIPSGPITIALNGFITDMVFNGFAEKWLPAYDVEITSAYRTPAQNEKADGAQYSAHLYNLARDFVLKDKNGNYIPAAQLEKVYQEFVSPNWQGYSYYNPPKTGVTGWIHVNLDRGITDKTKILEWTVSGVGLLLGIKKIANQLKKGKKP